MSLRTTPTIVICLVAGVGAAASLAIPGPSLPGSTPPPAVSPYASEQSADAAQQAEGSQPAASTVQINIADFAFDGQLTVSPGQVIEVTNLDGAPHTLSANDGSFDTGVLEGGETAQIVAPTTPGTYSFICRIHPSMTAELTVAP